MKKRFCKYCGEELKNTFLDLGLSPLSNEYLSDEDIEKGQRFFPLNVKVCDKCKLVQALDYQKPNEIFSDYKYFSSFSKSWLKHCEDYVDMITFRMNLNSESNVYEIACNDGYLLQYFKKYEVPTLGIEPAANVADEAKKKGIEVEVAFWSKEFAEELVEKRGKADLIIGNNVLAHVPMINDFIDGMKIALKDEGTITVEFPHLLQLMKYNQFDTIYHEHFFYYSLLTVEKMFHSHGLKIYDIDELDTHGGSLRVYATHIGNNKVSQSNNVKYVLEKEMEYGLDDIETYGLFADRVNKIKRASIKVLGELKEEGARIAAFGAAAKGNTFLNYCGIGREYIDFVVDSNTAKQGLYLPGTLIPIASPTYILEKKPEYIVILPWNLKEELTELLSYTREWGCKFITFIPEVEIF